MPILGIIILNLPFRDIMKRAAFWFAFILFSLQILLAMFHPLGFWSAQFEAIDSFFHVLISVDHLTFLMLLSIGIVSLASLLVSRYTISDKDARFNFINLMIIASIGMCGIVMVKDIFSLYVFLEVTAVSSFIMIAFNKNRQALEGAFKYIVLSSIATVMMLAGIALFFVIAGDTSFASIKWAAGKTPVNPIMFAAMPLFLCGLLIKGGLMPFHGWVPDAYSTAPAPAAVFLAGIVTKVGGIYTLIRIGASIFVFTAHMRQIFLFVGALSIVLGAFAALGQKNFSRMLAYSSISQIGYIVLGLGAGSILGIAGAVFHFFNHAIFKSQLFINSAAVELSTGTKNMDELGGLSSKMPITGTTSVIATLSTCGIPPFAGFWSKLLIIMALWEASHYIYACVAVIAGILTLAYLLSMQRQVFFGRLAAGLENIKEASFGICTVSIILALITIGAGVFFPVIFNSFLMPLADIFLRQ